MRTTVRVLAASMMLAAAAVGCGTDSAEPDPTDTTRPQKDVSEVAEPHPTVSDAKDAGVSVAFAVESPPEDALPTLDLNGEQIPFDEVVRDERTDPKAVLSALLPLEPGEHVLVIRYSDGESDSFAFELGNDLLYVTVVFWGLDREERVTFSSSTEPQGFA